MPQDETSGPEQDPTVAPLNVPSNLNYNSGMHIPKLSQGCCWLQSLPWQGHKSIYPFALWIHKNHIPKLGSDLVV